ncbi:hypothetical protein K9N50_11485 [bacterium]|nr:hypothetical protein [bacterium]
MNRKQKVVILVGICLFVLMGFFHPVTRNRHRVTGVYSQNYSCILSGKKTVDIKRLAIQWTMVIVATGGIVFLLKD